MATAWSNTRTVPGDGSGASSAAGARSSSSEWPEALGASRKRARTFDDTDAATPATGAEQVATRSDALAGLRVILFY